MKCPVDDTTLQMTEREGIEIDYCPERRGVWLDRGELDRIIERAAARDTTHEPSDHDHHDTHGDREHTEHKPKKRLSFLTDLIGGGEDRIPGPPNQSPPNRKAPVPDVVL